MNRIVKEPSDTMFVIRTFKKLEKKGINTEQIPN